MSNLNWPESATHYGSETLQFNPGFYKKDGDKWLFMSEYFAPNGVWNTASKEDDPARYIERQSAQPKQWSGPQDGLPPVNTECEVETDYGVWEHGVILCHGYDDFKPHAVAQCASGLWMEEVTGFRAIKTPEQLSAELRETAIREIMDIADVDCRVTAARLVDAGFKREVV
jgi:hypothetical protein